FDLKFPHHENEIAQEEAHDHRNIANIWMHNGFINLDNQKMSKSLGNVVLAKDLIEKFGGNLIRLLILSTHYRSPVNLTEETITSSKNELMKIEKTYNMASVKMQLEGLKFKKDVDIAPFLNALADDLNTSNALAEVYKTIKDLNMLLRVNPIDKDKLCDTFSSLDAMLNILGIIIDAPKLTDELKNIYIEYLNLKKEKRFEESDKLRDVLIANKII
ncbi:MAG: DALR domain-containing protein, partial [Bacilli bacterium]|nr:DALR domain-containing protein [Bacilli bacterium]